MTYISGIIVANGVKEPCSAPTFVMYVFNVLTTSSISIYDRTLLNLCGRAAIWTFNCHCLTPFLFEKNSYYPRSVHAHFQGLCVVFGLLIYIPSARLTEQLAFPPLRLCESAESDPITSVGESFSPVGLLRLVRFPLQVAVGSSHLLLTLILYHNSQKKSSLFHQKFCTKLQCANLNFLCKLPGSCSGDIVNFLTMQETKKRAFLPSYFQRYILIIAAIVYNFILSHEVYPHF